MGTITKIFPLFCIFCACVLDSCLGFKEENEQNFHNINLTSIDVIRKYGYPAEVHKAQTEDGYILEFHRIPHGKYTNSNRGVPILLVHGLMASSMEFLLLESDSLAFILADAGYDVWMLNLRGSTYSMSHTSMKSDDKKFWDFSWHENGVYDIPAGINYVCKYTKRDQILFIGYSMGTTAFFAFASTRPEYQEKLIGAILIAPTAYVRHTKTPLRLLAPFSKTIKGFYDFFAKGGILEQTPELQTFLKIACTPQFFCKNFLFVIAGRNSQGYHHEVLHKAVAHIPAGTSMKTVAHYGQLIMSGKFRQYDYGIGSNLRIYNQTRPPIYNLEAIKLPMIFFVAPNDYFSTKKDFEHLLQRLNSVKNIYVVPFAKFTHVDFALGKNLRELFYPALLKRVEYLMSQGTSAKPVRKRSKDHQNTAVPHVKDIQNHHNKIQNTRVDLNKLSHNLPNHITVNHHAIDRNEVVYNEPQYNPAYQIKYVYNTEYNPADFNTVSQNEIVYNEAEQNRNVYSEADYNLIDENKVDFNDDQYNQAEVVYNGGQYSQNNVLNSANYNSAAYNPVNQKKIVYKNDDYNLIDQNNVVYNKVSPYQLLYSNGQYSQAVQNNVVHNPNRNQYSQAIDQDKVVYNANYNSAAWNTVNQNEILYNETEQNKNVYNKGDYNSVDQNEVVYNEANSDTVAYNDDQYNQAVQNEVAYNEDQYSQDIDQNEVVYDSDYNSDAYISNNENEIDYDEEDEEENLYKVDFIPMKYKSKKVNYFPLNYKNVDYSGAQYSDF